MPDNGLKGGLFPGNNSGMKGGNSLSNPRTGLRGGMHNITPDRNKMLNPINLAGDKKPLIYGIADYYTGEVGVSTLTLNDIANTGNAWISNGSQTNRPVPVLNSLNGRSVLNYPSSLAQLLPRSSLSSTTRQSYTFMFMLKLNGLSGLTVLDTNTITAGSILVSTPTTAASPYRLDSRFYSGTSTGTIYTSDIGPTFSTSSTNTPDEFKDFMLVTIKYRLIQPTGRGSEQHMFINGRFHKILSGTDSFSTTINSTFAITSLFVGNNSSGLASSVGFNLGMALVLPYWVEYAEQVKIENYFRWYYRYNF
jgi:hypothetical protein